MSAITRGCHCSNDSRYSWLLQSVLLRRFRLCRVTDIPRLLCGSTGSKILQHRNGKDVSDMTSFWMCVARGAKRLEMGSVEGADWRPVWIGSGPEMVNTCLERRVTTKTIRKRNRSTYPTGIATVSTRNSAAHEMDEKLLDRDWKCTEQARIQHKMTTCRI